MLGERCDSLIFGHKVDSFKVEGLWKLAWPSSRAFAQISAPACAQSLRAQRKSLRTRPPKPGCLQVTSLGAVIDKVLDQSLLDSGIEKY